MEEPKCLESKLAVFGNLEAVNKGDTTLNLTSIGDGGWKYYVGARALHIRKGAEVDIVIEDGATVRINGKEWKGE